MPTTDESRDDANVPRPTPAEEMPEVTAKKYPGTGFLLGIFFRGAKSIVMQISFVMLLFSDQISGRGKSFQGANCLRGAPPSPLWKKAREEAETNPFTLVLKDGKSFEDGK